MHFDRQVLLNTSSSIRPITLSFGKWGEYKNNVVTCVAVVVASDVIKTAT